MMPVAPLPDAVIVDTNVALDWLVFRNPAVAPLFDRISSGGLRWLACDRMREELAHVLSRGVGDRHAAEDSAVLLAAWDRLPTLRPAPAAGASQRLHCSDADDQVFIDAAVVWQARWLVTRDRALLKLARRARRFGVEVLPPERCIEALQAPA